MVQVKAEDTSDRGGAHYEGNSHGDRQEDVYSYGGADRAEGGYDRHDDDYDADYAGYADYEDGYDGYEGYDDGYDYDDDYDYWMGFIILMFEF